MGPKLTVVSTLVCVRKTKVHSSDTIFTPSGIGYGLLGLLKKNNAFNILGHGAIPSGHIHVPGSPLWLKRDEGGRQLRPSTNICTKGGWAQHNIPVWATSTQVGREIYRPGVGEEMLRK